MISCIYCHTEMGKKPGCEHCDAEKARLSLLKEIREKVRKLEIYGGFIRIDGKKLRYIDLNDVLDLITQLEQEV